jgi:hypothetical protein
MVAEALAVAYGRGAFGCLLLAAALAVCWRWIGPKKLFFFSFQRIEAVL